MALLCLFHTRHRYDVTTDRHGMCTNISGEFAVCVNESPYKMLQWSVLKKTGSIHNVPDSKVHGANMGPTWYLSAPDGPHVGPMNLAIRGLLHLNAIQWVWYLILHVQYHWLLPASWHDDTLDLVIMGFCITAGYANRYMSHIEPSHHYICSKWSRTS